MGLVSYAAAKEMAFPGVLDDSQRNKIEKLIEAASKAAEVYCKRKFFAANYDEVYDTDGSGTLQLRNYPVLQVTRAAMAAQAVASITNSDNSTNSRALVATQQLTQADFPTPTTGLTLTRVASGVSTVDNSVIWVTYPTAQTVVNKVNSLGNGWSAKVQGGNGNWASADITPIMASQNALTIPASLLAFVTDLNDYEIVPETAELRFSSSFTGLLGTGWMPNQYPGTDLYPGTNLPRGSRNMRIQYRAGFNVIPEDLQYAVSLWATYLYQYPNQAGNILSETLGDYSYTRQILKHMPAEVKLMLNQYKDWSKAI